ncbi:hypothetical protein [Zooshikella sp. RANM57]|uniref:hypothetical protein n=1 Tax=Zooshikella sp. RANM57 TaxID=3425863 RepID=UPI003D6E9EB6
MSYEELTKGGKYNVELTQNEACLVLKLHDHGIEALSQDEIQLLYNIMAKLKDQIWP